MDSAGLLVQYNEQYSFRDFTNQDLRSATDLDGAVIKGSCFYQTCAEDFAGDPLRHIFPGDMRDVSFVECNLDNVYIPPGNTIRQCSHRRIKRMNDGEYWFVGEDFKPVEPIHEKRLKLLQANVDPKKIPAEKIPAVDLLKKRFEQMMIEQDAKPREP
jgi:hypothetical protein